MNKTSRPWIRKLLVFVGIPIALIAIVIIFLSPIAKYLVEKYDVKYTGRQITLGWVYVNPFTGFVHFSDLKIFEEKSDSVFFSSVGLSANFSMRKLFQKEYEIESLHFNKPQGIVNQYTKKLFNFTDLIKTFSSNPKNKNKKTTKVKFSLVNISINDGTFYMDEKMTPIKYYIKHFNLSSSGFRWDSDTLITNFTFESGIGSGLMEGMLKMNIKSLAYHTHLIIRRLDLKIIEQYIKDMSNYGKLEALINADFTATGNFKDARNVNAVGGLGVYNFRFGKTDDTDFASFDKFVIKVNHINPQKKIYIIDSISLVKPYARYEKYDHLDNIQAMFGVKGSKLKEAANSNKFNLVVEIAKYIRLLATNFLKSDYKLNRLGIYRANLNYEDYSIAEKFSMSLNPLTITGDSMSSDNERVEVFLRSGIKPFGNLGLRLSMNPKDSSDFELDVDLKKVNAAVLNPFLISYTSFPLDRGTIELKSNWRVQHGEIKSTNRFLMIDPRISDRVKANDNRRLPLKAIMFLVRERGNAVDYDIPITGDLKDPKFHFKDVIFDALTNLFVKPPTTPYRFEVKSIESSIENAIAFNWEMGSATLGKDQKRFVRQLKNFLSDHKSASIKVYPVHYVEKEKEYSAYYEAKKKYYLATNKKQNFTENDSLTVTRMSPKDSVFLAHLRGVVKNNQLYTAQALCSAYVGEKLLTDKFLKMMNARKRNFMKEFIEEGLDKQISLQDDDNQVPYNGFSYYQISYNGEIPEDLKEAFEELKIYDGQSPRKKLRSDRERTRRFYKASSN